MVMGDHFACAQSKTMKLVDLGPILVMYVGLYQVMMAYLASMADAMEKLNDYNYWDCLTCIKFYLKGQGMGGC